MYIWILLATIMVALSFFNLSPRADREDAVSRIKAATLVNRFKIEHFSLFKTLECDAVLRIDSLKNPTTGAGGWTDGSSEHSVLLEVAADGSAPDLAYTKYGDNLPMGYDLNISPIAQQIKHAVLCTSDRLESNDAEYKSCADTGYRYVISYMQIPERWLSAQLGDDDVVTPLPMFTSYINSGDNSGLFYGWTSCEEGENGGCVLHGALTVNRTFEEENGTTTVKFLNIGKDSVVWNDANFAEVCRTGTPCLFAYTQFPNNDKGGYCKHIYNKYQEQQG